MYPHLDHIHFILAILAVASGTHAQIPLWGSCPTVETFPDLDIARYMGRWYLVEAYVHFFELGLSCITADYFMSNFASSQASNPLVAVKNSGYSVMHNEEVASDGTAYPEEAGRLSKLKLHFPNVTGAGTTAADADYWVLDTDYDSHAIVWSCVQMEVFGASFINAQMLWILGRTPTLFETTIKTLKERIKSLGLNPSHLTKHDQENCPLKSSSLTSHQRTSRQGYGWNIHGSISRFPLVGVPAQVEEYPPNLFSANFLKAVHSGKF